MKVPLPHRHCHIKKAVNPHCQGTRVVLWVAWCNACGKQGTVTGKGVERQGRLQLAIANSVAAVKDNGSLRIRAVHLRDGTNASIIGQILRVLVGGGHSVMENARAPICTIWYYSGGVPQTASPPPSLTNSSPIISHILLHWHNQSQNVPVRHGKRLGTLRDATSTYRFPDGSCLQWYLYTFRATWLML